MYSARRTSLWLVWLLAGWLVAAQSVGLVHEQLVSQHPAESCLSCTLNGAAGGGLPSLPASVSVAPACAERFNATVLFCAERAPICAQARGPPSILVS